VIFVDTSALYALADAADPNHEKARHGEAIRALGARRRRRVSFVDLVSFAVMRTRGIRTAFAFDDDFEREGFEIAAAD
jgi:predicted nucleic acid-binding protein